MATGKIIGQTEVMSGVVGIVGVDGALRTAANGSLVYEGEQIVSIDSDALFQIKYSTLPEVTTYRGIFRVLANGSVISGTEAMDSIASDENLIDLLETAAGEEGAEGSSAYIPTDIVADSSVQDFGRGPNPAVLGLDGVEVDGTMEGLANNSPEALSEDITKIADYTVSEARNTFATVAALTFSGEEPIDVGAELVENISHNGLTYYGVRDFEQGNGKPLVDDHGEITEGVSFSFEEVMSSATLSFWNANDILNGNDNARIDLYLGDDKVGEINAALIITEHVGGEIVFPIDIDVDFDEIQVIAVETEGDGNQPTEFRVAFVDSYTADPTHTLLPFVIDDDMLLANDADMDGPNDALGVELVDGNLYHTDTGDIIGSVSINGDSGSEDYGSVLVTPDAGIFFDTHDPAFANFTYVVVDEDGGRSEPVSATIDVAVGTVVDPQEIDGPSTIVDPSVSYDPATSDDIDDDFMIGTDDNDAGAFDNNILIINEGTLDLSTVSEINTIQLEGSVDVIGSSDLGHVNPSDVISATDVDNRLIIQSSSDNDATDQIIVDTSSGGFTQGADVLGGVDGLDYAYYYDEAGATLLIEIPIEVT